jgi:hypothetical protein
MNAIMHSAKGLGLLFTLNWDRLIYLATIVLALMLGALIGSL